MKLIKSAVTVDLGGNLLPLDGLKNERWIYLGLTAGGYPVPYDRGTTIRWIPIVARITKATLLSLRSFFETTTFWGKFSFTFRPDPGWDVGGSGGYGDIGVHLWNKTYSERMVGEDVFEVSFLLRGLPASGP